jgi:hypothetical protein
MGSRPGDRTTSFGALTCRFVFSGDASPPRGLPAALYFRILVPRFANHFLTVKGAI